MMDPNSRVLIVDDQDLVGDILRAMLAAIGIRKVEQAMDGWDALLRLRSEPFDLALVDVNLGSMSGLQLLRAIRRDPQLRELLVLLITADRSAEVSQEARDALVNGVLHKPFSKNDLRNAITDAFRIWKPQLSQTAEADDAGSGSGSLSQRSTYLRRSNPV